MNKNLWRQIVILIAMVLFFNYFYQQMAPNQQLSTTSISYSRFKSELERDNIESLVFQGQTISGQFRKPVVPEPATAPPEAPGFLDFKTIVPPVADRELFPALERHAVEIVAQEEEKPSPLTSMLVYLLPWLLILGVWWFILKGMRERQGPGGGLMGGFSKSGARLYLQQRSPVTFKDVAGLDEVKQELLEIVDYLRNPKKFSRIGGKVPRGVLLVGPPGTGKTLVARAVAGEAEVAFFSISASQFIEMFVGVGASRVRDLFNTAKKSAPSIVFIDELDAVGRSRGTGLGGGNDEREQTLNQLLSEMDGFEPHEEVIVMSATNRPDVLDPALLRPGRFDRQVVLDRPDWRAREAILQVHVRPVPLAEDVDLRVIARATPGMCGADLENLVNEAALLAAREDAEQVCMAHFEKAKDRVLLGAERSLVLSDQEKRITACHEAGHALLARLCPGADPVHKVSIIPRGRALGITQQLPENDRYHYPRSYLVTRIVVCLAGRAAEKLIFGEYSTGAEQDLKQAGGLAEKMVCQWGMSDKLGPLAFDRGEEHPFLGRKLATSKTFSEQMTWIVDQEIEKIIKQAETQADEMVSDHRQALESLTAALLEEETLDGSRVDAILSKAGITLPVADSGAGNRSPAAE